MCKNDVAFILQTLIYFFSYSMNPFVTRMLQYEFLQSGDLEIVDRLGNIFKVFELD